MRDLTLYFDGSIGPINPGGTAGFGYTVYEDSKLLDSGTGIIGTGPQYSNNYSEFYALSQGLLAVSRILSQTNEKAQVTVKGDSQLVINVMNRLWRAKSGLYYEAYVLANKALTLLRHQGHVVLFTWIPRESNTEADGLSRVDYTPL